MENNNTSNDQDLNHQEGIPENVQRLEAYFSYLYSSGLRIVEQGARYLDDGTTLPERRKNYPEESNYLNIGREYLHGFIDRIRRELSEVIKRGETSVVINVGLPSLSEVYTGGVYNFTDDVSDYLKAKEGFEVRMYIAAENDNGSRDIRISVDKVVEKNSSSEQNVPVNPEDITTTEQYFEYLERDGGRRRTAKMDGQPVSGQSMQECRSPREGREAMAGFIERIKREILWAMEAGLDEIAIGVDWESIEKLSKDFRQTFSDDLFDGMNDNGGKFKVSEPLRLGSKGGRLQLIIHFDNIEKLNRNRKLNSSPKKKISTISSKVKLAILFAGALVVGIGGSAVYSHINKKDKSTQSQITEVDQSSNIAVEPAVDTEAQPEVQLEEDPVVVPEVDTEEDTEIDTEENPEADTEVEPVHSVDPEKIYCEVYRHPDGYNAACRGTENKKLSALEDDDDTDDLVPVQIDVARDGINYACKGVVQKTQPNEDGSVKTILAEDLDCEILE